MYRDTYITSIDVGRYKYNYEDFCKSFIYLMSINRGRAITAEGEDSFVFS